MAYEHKDGFGALFQNDKGGNDARPDYKGDCMIDGVMMEIAGWKKQGQKGSYLSLKIQPKREQPPASQQADPQAAGSNMDPAGYPDMDDEIPF